MEHSSRTLVYHNLIVQHSPPEATLQAVTNLNIRFKMQRLFKLKYVPVQNPLEKGED